MGVLGLARRPLVPVETAGDATAALSGGRSEAVVMLVRAAVLAAGAVGLILNEAVLKGSDDAFLAAGAWHAAAALACLVLAGVVSRVVDVAVARRAALLFAVLDVVAYALYAALFHDVNDAGTLYGVLVLLMPSIRWGWRGAAASVPTIATIATVWPQAQSNGGELDLLQVLLLCVVFVAPCVAISSLVRHWYGRLRQVESLLAGAFAHASSGMALLDRHGVLIQVNRALADLLGEDEEQLAGRPFLLSTLPDDRAVVAAAIGDLSTRHRAARAEVRLQTAEGSTRWVLLAASWMDGTATTPPSVLVQVENVTARKRIEQRLSHQATHDELTGLPNRVLLREHLEAGLTRGERLAVLFLDLDRFKVVNDGLGHAAGDAVLVEVAARLEAALRPGDLVARIGGDEFVLMARHVQGDADVRLLAERVHAVLRPPIRLERHEEVASASIGVALSHAGSTADALLRDADTAMYRAKGSGGGRSALFTPDMREAAVSAHELEVDLRLALVSGRLAVAYQPAVDLVTGRATGIEALARWEDDVRGLVSPTEFVAVAEQSDLVCQLGWFVLTTALRDTHRWRDADGSWGPPVSVNVSLRQLVEPDFAHRLAGLLDDAGVPPSSLCLEVTETALMGDTEPVVAALRALRAIGVALAIDDFGTGHASLTYLARFPVDVVKVDRSFVAGIGSDAGSAAIVGGVVAMAHAFGLRVVAEGPETAMQVALLRDLGCDAAQGFAFARPMGASDVTLLLRRGPMAVLPAPRPSRPEAVASAESRRYRLLLDGARDITACADVESVLERAFVALRRVVTFTGGSIQLVSGDVIRLAATDPPAPPEDLGVSVPLGQGVSGTMAVSGEPRYLPDITVASAARRSSGTLSPGVRSWYGVPLVAEGRIIGVLQVDSTEVDAFDEQDRLLVLSFAPVVAAGVQHARSWDRPLALVDRG